MDRNTEDTLSTYNTWIQLSRLQNIYHFQHILIKFVNKAFCGYKDALQEGQSLELDMLNQKWWTTLLRQHGFRLRGVQS